MKATAWPLWVVTLLCSLDVSMEEAHSRIEVKQLMPPENGVCSGAYVIDTVMRVEWIAHMPQDRVESGDHVEVYLGHGELSGVNLCYRWRKGDCGGERFSGQAGFCDLDGAISLNMTTGMHVVHLLLVTAEGNPVGPHETLLLHMPGEDDQNLSELDYDEFDEAQDFDLQRCGIGSELNFIELARQCERYHSDRFAERFFACAARQARNEGRTSAHAAVALQALYRFKDLPPDEVWKREQAEDAVASLTDGMTSVSERWKAALHIAQRRGLPSSTSPSHQGQVLNSSQPLTIGLLNISFKGVRSVSLAEFYDRQICGMDCVDLDSCYDSALYYLEFSRVDNHYRLLKFISSQLNDALIIDLGTHGGGSSFALGSNARNRVVSFDLDASHLTNQAHSCGKERQDFAALMPNVEYVVGDALELAPDRLLRADLVVLDTAHDGVWEGQLLRHLLDGGFRGLLLLDDIHANMPMELVWAGIGLPKWDLTQVGHALSGTGLVDFSHPPSR